MPTYTSNTTFTVTVTGTYDISAFGAQGGDSADGSSGGRGAQVGGLFTLIAGERIQIITGGQGSNGVGSSQNGIDGPGGGGGGGSFVLGSTNGGQTYSLLLAAGGGGGAGGSFQPAPIFPPTALPGGAGSATFGANGAGGNGGGNLDTNSRGGGGGAGYGGAGNTGAGADGGDQGFTGGSGAASYTSFGAGQGGGGNGGVGGGGGGGSRGGGGGGGYDGGDGGSFQTASTGGRSFNAGIANVAASGANSGAGSVTITPNPTSAPTTPAPCYATGTRVRVLRGLTIQDVPVECLRVGDTVISASGKPRPIRWIGTRSYPGFTAPKHDRPVRIRAGALGDGVPARDLLVSPDHCLWLDGLLVAAGHLVNGTSITRGEAVADLTYWHVELDSHDLLLAEGAQAESFLAAPGVRRQFDGAHIPDAATAPVPYAVRAEPRSPALMALSDRIVLRAGLSVDPVRLGKLRAWLDLCDGRRVAGWAQDAEHPDGAVCLDIVVDGEVVAMASAEQYRADVEAFGIGVGRHGFELDLDEPLAPGEAHTIEVRRSADGASIGMLRVDEAGRWTRPLAA